jgi:hypothetical protein
LLRCGSCSPTRLDSGVCSRAAAFARDVELTFNSAGGVHRCALLQEVLTRQPATLHRSLPQAALGAGEGAGWLMRSSVASRQAHAGALLLQMLAVGLMVDGSSNVPRRTMVRLGRPFRWTAVADSHGTSRRAPSMVASSCDRERHLKDNLHCAATSSTSGTESRIAASVPDRAVAGGSGESELPATEAGTCSHVRFDSK